MPSAAGRGEMIAPAQQAVGMALALWLLAGPGEVREEVRIDEAGDQAEEHARRQESEADRDPEKAPRDGARARSIAIATGPGSRELVGFVSEVSPLLGELSVLDPATGRQHELMVASRTGVFRAARPIPLREIREGEEVRASYVLRDGDLVAERIEVGERAAEPARILAPPEGRRPATLELSGWITEISAFGQWLELIDPSRRLSIELSFSGARIRAGGQPAGEDALTLGTEVRVVYSLEAGRLRASRIDVLRTPRAPAAAPR